MRHKLVSSGKLGSKFCRQSAIALILLPLLARPVWAGPDEPSAQGMAESTQPVSQCKTEPDALPKCAWIIVKSTGPSAKKYPRGLRFAENAKIVLKKFDTIIVVSKNRTRKIEGPGTFTLNRKFASTSAKLRSYISNRGTSRAKTGAVRNGANTPPPPPPPVSQEAPAPARAGIPVYPVWPPETPSSRVGLDRFIQSRANTSLYTAGQKLKRAFEDAGYLEHSYYAVPGGFALVTRIEKIKSNGDAFSGDERYRLPNQQRKSSLSSAIRDLFLDAPPGYYRYIAVVVSNKPFRTSGRRLSDTTAIRRLQNGSNNLSARYRQTVFNSDYKVEALIYEFRKNNQTGKTKMIAPGRLSANTHLAKTRLNRTVTSQFRR